MADAPIVQTLIAQRGQSQQERLPAELDPHYADVDQRDPAALRAYAGRLAGIVPFVTADGKAKEGGWKALFETPVGDGDTKPALGLFDAFTELYEFPRAAINTITGRHLDFFYQRVLGFAPHPATPDRAHVVLTLKKGAAPVRVTPAHMFSAGKNAAGLEVLYSPTAETIVNASGLESLRSVFVDHERGGRIRFAPIANSSDGLGAAMPEVSHAWKPFGHPDLPTAHVGFAIASPILRMKEGRRSITVTLAVDAAQGPLSGDVTAAFEAFLTGEKRWLGPYGAGASVSAGTLTFRIEIPPGDPAVASYNAGVHGQRYGTDAPVLQLLLRPEGGSAGYDDLRGLRVETLRLSVDVQGLTPQLLESDAGSLDPKKAFLPFGPEPQVGSRFMVGCEEALTKTLSRLDVTFHWKGAPASLAAQYIGYTGAPTGNAAFTVSAAFHDRASDHTRSGEPIFDASDARNETVLHLVGSSPQPRRPWLQGDYIFALNHGGTRWGRLEARRMVLRRPTGLSFLTRREEARPGFIVLTLNTGFLHAEYRRQSVEKVVARISDSRVQLLREPYTPTLQAISLGYTAQTETVRVSSTSADDYAQPDAQFFHVGPFGEMREHAHQRAALPFVPEARVPLLPQTDGDGELFIGLSGLDARDSVSVLFQVAQGSADPDVSAGRPQWFVLCDNYWKRLGTADVVRDTTNNLLSSGVVSFVIPSEATTENTILPGGLIWLKAAVARKPEATSLLVDVRPNAVEVQFVMDSGDAAAAHLAAGAPRGTIAKLKTPIASVTAVTQPYASFGGRRREEDTALRTRAAERLRHKARAIAPWDYERLILEAFPSVHTAKCIPHAKPGSWMAPGHVLMVVVPELRGRHVPNPLQPRVDADTIARIGDYLRERTSGHVAVTVKNPTFQRVRFACRVRFRQGFEFNFYSGLVMQALIRFLSPWAFESAAAPSFGGSVYRSVLLDLVEQLPYVDYVTDFRMFTFIDHDDRRDVDRALPAQPDAILVSDDTHEIGEAG